MKSRLILVAAALVAATICARGASAGSIDYLLKFGNIKGDATRPGLTNAIDVHSFTLANGALVDTHVIDSSAPQLAAAETSSILIPNGTIGLYDDPNTATHPDAQLPLHDILVSSIQPTTIGPQSAETVTYQFLSPTLALYLELPGISGESSAPGAPNVIAIDSLTITGNSFSVHKAIDSTSPALQSALLGAHDFVTASLLFYSSISTETKPDFSIVFAHALISNIASNGVSEQPTETVSFDATGSAVPEPSGLAWGPALALSALAQGRRRQ
jgi:type VI protein secretion system component Hcp